MRIAFVCNEYPPSPHGGIGSMVQTLACAFVRAGHEVRVAGLYPDVLAPACDADAGVRVWRLPVKRGRLRWMEGRVQLFRHVAAWARRAEVDVIEVPDWQGLAAYWPRLPVPVVVRLNGSAVYFDAEMARPTRWLTRTLERASLARADAWSSVSRYTADRTKALFGLRSDPSCILPNPVSLAPATDWARRREGAVVFSGTLTEKKGVVPLMDAWNQVAVRYPRATLHLFGKDGVAPGGGSMTTFLRSRLEGEAARRVTFHGRVSRETVLEEMATARVAVFPSFAEAFAIAPLEAMATGCPTIGSSLGSGPEQIEDGRTGLTADPAQPEQIAQAMMRLLADERLSQAVGENGRRNVQRRFSVEGVLAANETFYRSSIDARRVATASPLRTSARMGERPTPLRTEDRG